MVSSLRQTWTLLFVGLLLPSVTGCSPAVNGVSESQAKPSASQLKIVRDPIALGPSLNGSVKTVRFFEGDRSRLAMGKNRTYRSRFARATTRTIYTEINLEHPQPGKNIYFPLTLYFLRDGETVRIEEIEARLEPNWTSSEQVIGAGNFSPGKWRVGKYEVDVYIVAEKVATGYFEIY